MYKIIMKEIIILFLLLIYVRTSHIDDSNIVLFVNNTYTTSSVPFFDFIIFDDLKNLIIGGVDTIYQLNGTTLELIKLKNLSALVEYSSTYSTSISNCLSLYKNQDACRNHIRVIQKMENGNIYVCSSGAYSPQEYYLDANYSFISLGGKGDKKCPYDPFSHNLFYSTAGYMFTALHVSPTLGFQIFRVQLNSTSTTLKNDLVLSDIHYISIIEISDHIYFFFREMSQKDSALGAFQESRVARICKNDNGGMAFINQFMTYSKARIVCVINNTGKNPLVFNELVNIQYDSYRKVFYGLFQLNGNLKFGSAVCTYNYSSIEKLFVESEYTYLEPNKASWINEDPSKVPKPRPTMCKRDTLQMNSEEQLFVLRSFMMADIVLPNDKIPTLYVSEYTFSKFTYVNLNITHSIFYLVSEDNSLIIKRYLLNVIDFAPQMLPDLILNAAIAPTDFKDIQLHNYNNANYIYLLYSNVLLQISAQVCSSYRYCTSCNADVMCKWEDDACIYNTGFQNSYSTNPCKLNCYDSKLSVIAIPGMSLTLPFNSKCRTRNPVNWLFNNGTTAISNNKEYVISDNSSLIILNYNVTAAGNYKCVDGDVILVEYDVQNSVCEFKEDLRSVIITEFKQWCNEMDKYTRQKLIKN